MLTGRNTLGPHPYRLESSQLLQEALVKSQALLSPLSALLTWEAQYEVFVFQKRGPERDLQNPPLSCVSPSRIQANLDITIGYLEAVSATHGTKAISQLAGRRSLLCSPSQLILTRHYLCSTGIMPCVPEARGICHMSLDLLELTQPCQKSPRLSTEVIAEVLIN